MFMANTAYTRSAVYAPYKVTFKNEKGVELIKGFDSPYFMMKFVNKLKHSKTCALISHTYVSGY